MDSRTDRDETIPRRGFLRRSVAAGAAFAAPWVVPSSVLGRNGAIAPGEKITLGVIGIGPRCTYDLKSMLAFPDVRCVAICDVQASRREAGKTLVDRALREQGLRPLSRLPRAARPARDRRRPDRHRRPLARLRLDPGGEGGQGRLQREALRPDHRQLPGPGRHDEADRPGLPGRHPAAERPQLPGGRRTGQERQARQAPHPLRLGLHAPARQRLAPWRADPAARRGRLEPLARPGPLAAVQPRLRLRGLAGLLRLRFRRPAARLGRAHRRPLPVGQRGRRHHAHRVRAVDRPTSPARYANGVKLVLDFLKTPFGDRPGWFNHLGTCPVRFVGERAGSRPATAARSRSIRPRSRTS